MEALNYSEFIEDITNIAVRARLLELINKTSEILNCRVCYGPFKGMLLPMHLEEVTRYGWDDGSKMLGCYEKELHDSLEKAIYKKPDIVINIGCAEGYYAIGLARRLPESEVYAFDTEPEAQELCAVAAKENDVAERVHLRGTCSERDLLELIDNNKKILLIIDCEGGELELLTEKVVSLLKNSDIIVECHDFSNDSITPTLLKLLISSHHIEKIRESERDLGFYPFLKSLSSFDRMLLVCEFRPRMMHWLICSARVKPPSSNTTTS